MSQAKRSEYLGFIKWRKIQDVVERVYLYPFPHRGATASAPMFVHTVATSSQWVSKHLPCNTTKWERNSHTWVHFISFISDQGCISKIFHMLLTLSSFCSRNTQLVHFLKNLPQQFIYSIIKIFLVSEKTDWKKSENSRIPNTVNHGSCENIVTMLLKQMLQTGGESPGTPPENPGLGACLPGKTLITYFHSSMTGKSVGSQKGTCTFVWHYLN